ncbi:hypothetical protein [Pseudomonas alloputida]|uniref:capsular polysaccharide export protein, LipB/KpsS family n=1 Tax=Pseudomonas alloputida TaxID=1940621 RepID=UPI001E610CE5|nr:hypothetical protein [Pseudomonas alloputida]MCE1056025.1 hypothetical protein [Pseudomonas alloputida]
MKILIQCGDHFENQNRIMTLASTLKDLGCTPIVLLYSNKKGRYFENAGIQTIACEDHVPSTPVPNGTKIDSFLEEGITYNDVLEPEQRRRPIVGWPGQRARSINDIYRHYSTLNSVISTCKPDKIVVWNGFTGYVANILRLISEQRKIPSAFLERGLLKNSLFIDRQGVNGASSLNSVTAIVLDALTVSAQQQEKIIELFQVAPEQPEKPKSQIRNVFFPLQVQLDTNIIMYSPYRSMRQAFFDIYDALNKSPSNFLVRPHPEELPETSPNIPRYENVKTSTAQTLDHWLEWSDIVVTINSTVGLEALIKGKKVITLGGSIYSCAGLTSSLTKDLDLSPKDLRTRLIKYLAYLTRSNLLIHGSNANHFAIAKQLEIPLERYKPPVVNNTKAEPIIDQAVIALDLPLNTTIDLTYRNNKVKINHTWILSIAKQHVSAKKYAIIPYDPNGSVNATIKIVKECRTVKADSRFSKTIDIYGNLVR